MISPADRLMHAVLTTFSSHLQHGITLIEEVFLLGGGLSDLPNHPLHPLPLQPTTFAPPPRARPANLPPSQEIQAWRSRSS